jgi:hypothetical protein
MDSDFNPRKLGEQLGFDAVDRVVALAEDYCDCERQLIEFANEPRIQELNAEMAIDAEDLTRLDEQLRLVKPPLNRSGHKREALYYWLVALILAGASFVFSVITFEPYRFGWKSYLFCIGIAIATPFALEKLLKEWNCRNLIKGITTAAFIGAMSSLMLLAAIRGNVLAQQIQAGSAPVEIDADDHAPAQEQNSFYRETVGALRAAMALLALAMELCSGLAWFEARQLSATSSDDEYLKLRAAKREIQHRMASRLYESTALLKGPQIFVARFWCNFYRAMLTHTLKRGLLKLLVLALFAPLFCLAQATPTNNLNLVVALDLSSSVAATGRDGKTEFAKDVVAITHLLGSVPPGAKITVIGITENSFSQPFILLSATVSDDKGYFGERLSSARQVLTRTWQDRSSRLEPRSQGTDILGAIMVAAQIFKARSTRRKLLVIYSDMRHFGRDLNLETQNDISVDAALETVLEGGPVPDLKEVEVYALGVDAAGREMHQWEKVHQFWIAYFEKSGASARSYSILRDALDLNGIGENLLPR